MGMCKAHGVDITQPLPDIQDEDLMAEYPTPHVPSETELAVMRATHMMSAFEAASDTDMAAKVEDYCRTVLHTGAPCVFWKPEWGGIPTAIDRVNPHDAITSIRHLFLAQNAMTEAEAADARAEAAEAEVVRVSEQLRAATKKRRSEGPKEKKKKSKE
jgi:hypothetical protein